ncbi:MAG: DUF4212 domain-containing protein [Bacteroidales bacterium]
MKDAENGYHISFFKPTTERARFNRNLVVWLASVWFITIFGFQIALRVMQKPTPEPSFTIFENVWDNISNSTATEGEIRQFGFSVLSVLGKVAITHDERVILSEAMSWSVYKLVPDSLQPGVYAEMQDFAALKAAISNISDEEYIEAKQFLSDKYGNLLGLSPYDPRRIVIPIELTVNNIESLSDASVHSLPSIMEKYLVHNQSVLTDIKFLGFPFHYFYTAVFLLVLFVGLCWIYCVRSDRRNKVLGIED